MTKKEYEKYHVKVRDKYNELLSPGDTVIFSDSYLRDVHIGTIKHFAGNTVIITYKYPNWKYEIKVQRYSDRIIKLKDKDGKCLFT